MQPSFLEHIHEYRPSLAPLQIDTYTMSAKDVRISRMVVSRFGSCHFLHYCTEAFNFALHSLLTCELVFGGIQLCAKAVHLFLLFFQSFLFHLIVGTSIYVGLTVRELRGVTFGVVFSFHRSGFLVYMCARVDLSVAAVVPGEISIASYFLSGRRTLTEIREEPEYLSAHFSKLARPDEM